MTGDFAEKRLFWRETDTAPVSPTEQTCHQEME